jgi:hypothetical protein
MARRAETVWRDAVTRCREMLHHQILLLRKRPEARFTDKRFPARYRSLTGLRSPGSVPLDDDGNVPERYRTGYKWERITELIASGAPGAPATTTSAFASNAVE